MKILVFLHGTTVVHKNAVGKTREEIIRQVQNQEESVRDFASHIPIGNAPEKLQTWAKQGAIIIYLSALTENKKGRNDEVVGREGLIADQKVLDKYHFPKGEIYHREDGESYADIAEKLMPDILIEDDCESIGGEKEMTYTNIKPKLKPKIKQIVVKEFAGIDHLPNNIEELI